MLLHHFLTAADRLLSFQSARAHCDIPCGIYDPAPALIASLSVIRMMDLIKELNSAADGSVDTLKLQRCVDLKEIEAEKVKAEVRIIWGDYFKATHIETYPEIHSLVHAIMATASKCKQGTAREDGEALLEKVNQFAEVFWKSKGIEPVSKKYPSPPGMSVIYPSL